MATNKYRSRNKNLVDVLFNSLIKNGKIKFRENFLKKVCLELKKKQVTEQALSFIMREVNKLRIPIGLRTKQIAGAKVRIPVPQPVRQQIIFVIKSMLAGAKKRHSSNYLTPENFVLELLETKNGELTNTKKSIKDQIRTIVENRALVRFI
jgi:ribosomal protein S7